MEAINYHLELSPAQLKVLHAALRDLLAGAGDDQAQVRDLIAEVLAKLPDQQAIDAIKLDRPVETVEPESTPPDAGPGPSAA